jgi:hypothetical protein
MYSDWLVFFGLPAAAILIWLLILSYNQRKQDKLLKSLFPKFGERDIRKKFEEILELERKIGNLEKGLVQGISKVELIRYNPYEDTGGDQSFSVVLLNKENTGLVITSLHSRSGTRVFAKEVIMGKAGKFQFSKEESEAVEKALK